MILRFKSASSSQKYIAFNSTLKTYTTNPAEVKRGQVLTLACNHFDHVAREISFNGYDYTDDLTAPAEVKRGQVLTLACNHFEHVVREISFNGYDYTDDLTAPAEVEEVPAF